MEQIEKGIYIENSYVGVTLGALALANGTILVDSPPCPNESRSWRAALRNLGTGVNRLLVNLDDHYDRTLGARSLECPVIAHEITADSFDTRSAVFKAQPLESGAEWEECIGLSGIRWAPPTLAFDRISNLYFDEEPLILEHHPGPTSGAIWIVLPDKNLIFAGDAVISGQPPFMAEADIPAWLNTLDLLLSADYRNYLVISGRSGPVAQQDLRAQRRMLKYIHRRLETLAGREAEPEATEQLIPKLLSDIEYPEERQEQYEQRLRYGLYHYYSRHYWPGEVLIET